MAESPAHKFGQIIGNALEETIEPLLSEFARQNGLFLDKKGPRKARSGIKVTWKDKYGNEHDLDLVLERGGTPNKLGTPVAFIESAWRRYTKHSRNKVQEIQGAIQPLLETYQNAKPFAGTVLAGEFTSGALGQLRAHGFAVVYFPYASVIEAFRRVGVNAQFDEDTPDAEFSRRIRTWEKLSSARRRDVASTLRELNAEEIAHFIEILRSVVTRRILRVRVLPLHGNPHELGSILDAIAFVERYVEGNAPGPLAKYEVQVIYSNGDRIDGQFGEKTSAVAFLRSFQP